MICNSIPILTLNHCTFDIGLEFVLGLYLGNQITMLPTPFFPIFAIGANSIMYAENEF